VEPSAAHSVTIIYNFCLDNGRIPSDVVNAAKRELAKAIRSYKAAMFKKGRK